MLKDEFKFLKYKYKNARQKYQAQQQEGATLIETLVGLTVLAIGIGATAALAVNSFGASASTSMQLVATGLARESMEAVRNMRDTNWLKANSIDNNCYNYVSGANDARCYKNWQTQSGPQLYDLDPSGGSASYILDFDPSSATSWNFHSPSGAAKADRYKLWIQNEPLEAFYSHTQSANFSGFYRKITLTEENEAFPYNQNLGPRLKIIVQVWWTDKNCRTSDDWPDVGPCSLELISYLSNWKN